MMGLGRGMLFLKRGFLVSSRKFSVLKERADLNQSLPSLKLRVSKST